MPYNRINYLKRAIEVQNIVLEYKKKEVTQRWIYENVIRDRYYISESTFNHYLSINAKRELQKLQEP